jgi:hypothetical protein
MYVCMYACVYISLSLFSTLELRLGGKRDGYGDARDILHATYSSSFKNLSLIRRDSSLGSVFEMTLTGLLCTVASVLQWVGGFLP